MTPMSYVPVTLSGKRDRYFVGRVSVCGRSVATTFEVATAHEAKIIADRLEFARGQLGDMEGTAVIVPSPVSNRRKPSSE